MKPRNLYELDLMRKSGEISAQALKKTIRAVVPGVSLLELEKIAEKEILRLGGKPSFKSVPGYNWTTCLTVNNEVVHGPPRPIELKKGDIISIDLGTVYRGWHSDCAWSVVVGGEQTLFLAIGEESMWKGIAQARAGNHIGDISNAMQSVVEEKGGYCVVRSLVGHGIGKKLHEEPEVPGFGKKGTGLKLLSGMTFAIEVIYTESAYDVILAADKWTYLSSDGSLAGMFEMTVIVGDEKAEVLTDWRSV